MGKKTNKQEVLDQRGELRVSSDRRHGGTENAAAQITALIMAGATVIGYTIGEGLTDAAHSGDGGDGDA